METKSVGVKSQISSSVKGNISQGPLFTLTMVTDHSKVNCSEYWPGTPLNLCVHLLKVTINKQGLKICIRTKNNLLL